MIGNTEIIDMWFHSPVVVTILSIISILTIVGCTDMFMDSVEEILKLNKFSNFVIWVMFFFFIITSLCYYVIGLAWIVININIWIISAFVVGVVLLTALSVGTCHS